MPQAAMDRPFLAKPVPPSLKRSFEKLDAALWIAVSSWMQRHGKVRSPHIFFYQSLLNESFWQNPCRSKYSSQENSIAVDAQVIKPKLSDEQKRQLKMTFNLMDADGGGTIDGRALTPGPSLPLN